MLVQAWVQLPEDAKCGRGCDEQDEHLQDEHFRRPRQPGRSNLAATTPFFLQMPKQASCRGLQLHPGTSRSAKDEKKHTFMPLPPLQLRERPAATRQRRRRFVSI